MGRKLFGTSGVRGYTNIEITPQFAIELTECYALYLRLHFDNRHEHDIAVGCDTRYGAEMLKCAVTAALCAMGYNVYDCGVLPTPALAVYVNKNSNIIGGVMVTGSHMPQDRIGLIYLDNEGAYMHEGHTNVIEDYYNTQSPRQVERLNAQDLGIIMPHHDDDVLNFYMRFLNTVVDTSVLKRNKRLRIVVDPGNGTATFVLPQMLREYGHDVITINAVPKGDFDRAAEPRAYTLHATAHKVVECNADLGIATDVDADRVLFIDDEGNVISEDVIGAIFAKRIFAYNNGRTCVTPVNSSGLIEYVAREYGMKVEYCRIGQPATERAIKEFNAVYAYEESGKYYFPLLTVGCDGILSALKIIEIMLTENKPLSTLANEFPKFYQSKLSIRCEDAIKSDVIKNVARLWTSIGIENRHKDITIDGYKRVYNDDSWLLLRPSGTEPLFRIYADARTQTRADELVAVGREIVEKSMEMCRNGVDA